MKTLIVILRNRFEEESIASLSLDEISFSERTQTAVILFVFVARYFADDDSPAGNKYEN